MEFDIVIFHVPEENRRKQKLYELLTDRGNRTVDQLYLGLSMESSSYFQQMSNQTYMDKYFNLTAGYPYLDKRYWQSHVNTLSTHVYIPYGPHPYNSTSYSDHHFQFGYDREIPQNRSKMVMWMASNCLDNIGRIQIVQDLMSFIQVDSYGKCLHNTDSSFLKYPKSFESPAPYKKELMSQYQFVIAIENSQCSSYITEKLWEPLSAGSIPIYLGAPDINDYIPTPESIINIRDFNSIEQLASYIEQVYQNETLRLKHLKWISEPWSWSKNFQIYLNNSIISNPFICNLCKLAMDMKFNHPYTRLSPLPNIFKKCDGKFLIPKNNNLAKSLQSTKVKSTTTTSITLPTQTPLESTSPQASSTTSKIEQSIGFD
eukprot:gene6741-8358_t